MIGEGISGAFALPEAGARGRKLAQRVLEAVGSVLWLISEDMLDAVTAVSGSGPAYVFYFLEGLEQAALELGFTKADARTLAYATFAGTVKLASGSELEPAILRAQVTSKGGTTERAMALLEADAVKAKFVAAVKAAALRAQGNGRSIGVGELRLSRHGRTSHPLSARRRLRAFHVRVAAAVRDAVACARRFAIRWGRPSSR